MKLHPDIVAYFSSVSAEFPPPGTVPTAAESRALHKRLAARNGPGRALRRVRNIAVPGPAGPIACRLYSDQDGTNQPACIFLHGGGWIGGDLETHDIFCRELAHGSGYAVVAVDYRLAPEHKFPAAFEDSLSACSYLLEHGLELGLDPTRVAIGGDSAGGNLCAAVVQTLLDRAGPQPILQYLIYPALDLRLASRSFDEMRPPAFSAAEAVWCLDQYLNCPSEVRDPRASPALAEDFSGLPPAYIVTAECDGLRDDGEAYALSLARAGVPVQLRRYLGVTHGFLSLPPSYGVTAAGIADLCRALRIALVAD